MSSSDGIVDSMSPEEEERLLAEYGVGSTAELLIPPSAYQSHVTGSSDLFLTGTHDVEGNTGNLAEASMEQDLTLPLDLLTIKCHSTIVEDQLKPEVRELELLVRHYDCLSRGIETTTKTSTDPGEDSFDHQLAELDALMKKADEEVARQDYHYVAECGSERQSHDELDSALDDDEVFEGEPLYVLLTKEEKNEIKSAMERGEDEAAQYQLTDEEKQEHQRLAEEDEKWREKLEEATITAQRQLSEAATTIGRRVAQVTAAQQELLHTILTIETRDEEMDHQILLSAPLMREVECAHQEEKAAAEVERIFTNGTNDLSSRGRAKPVRNEGKPLLVRKRPENRFENKVDKLLPPTDFVADMCEFEKIVRRDRRLEVLEARQLKETQLMWAEDMKAEMQERQIRKELNAIKQALNSLQGEEEQRRKSILGEEALGAADIHTRESRQRVIIVQWMQHKAAQTLAQKTSETVDSEAKVRVTIRDMEAYEWIDLMQAHESAVHQLVAELSERKRKAHARAAEIANELKQRVRQEWSCALKKNVEAARMSVAAALSCDEFGDAFPSPMEKWALDSYATVVGLVGCGARMQALSHQISMKSEWIQGSKAETAMLLQFLGQMLKDARHDEPPPLSTAASKKRSSIHSAVQHARKLTPPDAKPFQLESSEILDRSAVERHHPHLFAAANAVLGTRRVNSATKLNLYRRIFSKLAVSLEGISSIDYDDLSTLVDQERDAASSIPIPGFVMDLNLSGNSLKEADCDKLLAVFPRLARLTLSDNQLTKLAAAASSSHPSLRHLDISANKMETLDFLAAFPALQTLSCFSNSLVSSLALRHCSHLHTLELSRNNLKELDGLQGLPSLVSLDCSRNALTSMASLGHNLLMENLYLANNQITEFPSRLPLVFLRSLFLSDNKLVSIPDVSWLPLLQTLHLDSNRISELKGLGSCTMLTTLHLAFNCISTLAEVQALAPCKSIAVLSVNDNPVTMTNTDREETHTLALSMFPLLRELDSAPVAKGQREAALRCMFWDHCQGIAAFAIAALPEQQLASLFVNNQWSVSKLADATYSLHHSSSSDAAAVGLDHHLRRLQKEYDAVAIAQKRKYQTVVSEEESYFLRVKEKRSSAGLPSLLLRSSEELWQSHYFAKLRMLQRYLQQLRESVEVAAVTNVHSLSASYAAKAQLHKETTSVKRLTNWIYNAHLCRKARRELNDLKEKSEAGRMKRLAAAAMKIQPVWRGAWTRMRLKKAKMYTDFDDTELFQKVDTDLKFAPTTFGNVANMLQSALLAHPDGPQFHLPTRPVPMSPEAPRTGSAPQRAGLSRSQGDRPQSNPQSVPPQHAFNGPLTSSSLVESEPVDNAWGEMVAAQMKKREKKMERVKREALKKEFETDPLQARRKQQVQMTKK